MKKNLDVLETEKFEALAENWWDREGPCRPLHDLNPTRLQFIVDRCSIEEKTILDIGCGAGILSESLAKRHAFVTGIDASPTLVQAAKQHARSHAHAMEHLRYEVSTAETFAKENPQVFDVVTCMELLEHVPSPLELIQSCANLVKPQGHLFFSTLNRTPKSFFLAVVGAEYVLNLLPKHTHQYSKFIRPSEFAESLRKANLYLEELAGLDYNPFTRQSKLSSDVSINYLAHVIKLG